MFQALQLHIVAQVPLHIPWNNHQKRRALLSSAQRSGLSWYSALSARVHAQLLLVFVIMMTSVDAST